MTKNLHHNNIPESRGENVMYVRIVVDYLPKKDDPYHTLLIVGGNVIKYSGGVITQTADLTTATLLVNSTISTPES